MLRLCCAHCGLPVSVRSAASGERVFCCHGCRLVAQIVGAQAGQGERSWELLRLGLGAFLSMDVMMISLLFYSGEAEPEVLPVFRWVQLGLSAPALLLLLPPFARAALDELLRGRPSLDTLVAAGSLTAFALSCWATVRGEDGLYFDTATMLLTLMTLGKLIEAGARQRTGQLLRSLAALLPASALRLEEDGAREVPLSALRVGDRLRVRPGERFAVDGLISEGHTRVEDAVFTGDAWPGERGPGDAVLAGATNGEGAVVVVADRVGPELLLQRVIEVVERSPLEPGRAERLAHRLGRWMVPAVLLLATAAGLWWLAFFGPEEAGRVTLSVLAVGCPCAMGLAAPLATSLAIGLAARQGVVVRGGEALERLGGLRTVFFDKTGTLTAGRPTLISVEALDGQSSPEELLSWMASLEVHGGYAPAQAVVAAAKAGGLPLGTVESLRTFAGLGLRGEVSRGGVRREIIAGSERFIRLCCPESAGEALGPAPSSEGSALYVAWGGRVRGRALIADRVCADAAGAIRQLHQIGISTALISGDGQEAAAAVARQVGIGRVEAPRMPEEKVFAIREAALRGPVAMIGDGLNDAPALAAAEVGIAVGAGADLARRSGQVVLLHAGLGHIPWLVALGRRTRALIVQNLAWATAYNAVALWAAATGRLHPLLAAVAMLLSSITVMGNSLRLLRFPEPQASRRPEGAMSGDAQPSPRP